MKKELSLLSPKTFDYDKKTTFFSEISTEEAIYYDTNMGISTPVIFDVIGLGKIEDNTIIEKAENLVTHLRNKKVAECMYVVNSKVGYCSSHLTQRINDKLKNINDVLRENPLLKEVYEKNIKNDDKKGKIVIEKLKKAKGVFKDDVSLDSLYEMYNEINNSPDEKEKTYQRCEFTLHRDLFSEALKAKKEPKLNEILERYDLKNLTTTLTQFINDRNIYTHGIVKYWGSEKKTMIMYVEKGEKIYATIDKNILNSFIQCYGDLDNFLSEVEHIMDIVYRVKVSPNDELVSLK